MPSDTLKPCPFCGADAQRLDIEDGENAGGSCICCTGCMASGNVEFGRKENFVSNWNRRLTPTDTDTAIPAGSGLSEHALHLRLMGLAATLRREEFDEDHSSALDVEEAARRLAAASPKPDTDTPVDPGVEGVRAAEEVERDIRIAIWNAGMASAMGQNRTQAFIRRAMAEPMMARALAALAAKPIAGMDAGEVEDA